MKALNFLILSIVILLSGCSERGQVDSRLVKADTLLLREKPDSAKLLLDKVALSSLQTDEEKAYYYMLLTHTKYRLYKTTASDTMVAFSVDYYTRAKDEKKLARALYYKGVVWCELGETDQALHAIKQAEILAEKQNDKVLCHKIYMNLSTINIKSNNLNKALVYAGKSIETSLETNDKASIANSFHKMSVVYSKLDKPDSALHYASKSLCYMQYLDKAERGELLQNVAVCYSNVRKYKEAEHYILQSISTTHSAHAYYVLGGIHIAQGKEREAWDAWMKALETGGVETKVLVFDYIVEYKGQKGKLEELARWNDSLLLYHDSLKRMQKTEQTLQIQESSDKKTAVDKTKSNAAAVVLALSAAALAGLLLFYVIMRVKKRKYRLTVVDMNRRIENFTRHIEELQKEGLDNQKEITKLKGRLDDVKNRRRMVELKFGRQCLNSLTNGGTTAVWKDEEYDALFEYVKSEYPEILQRIEREYSGLSNLNKLLLVLTALEWKSAEIAHAMNTSPGAVRTMRSRIAKHKNLP